MTEAIRTGLQEEHFKDPEARQIWRHLKKHWAARATKNTVPSLASIQNQWSSFKMVGIYGQKGGILSGEERDSEDAHVKALIHELKLRSFDADARSLLGYFQDLVEQEDTHEAVVVMQTHLTGLINRLRYSGHLGLKDVVAHARDHYESAQDGSILGLPWPWKCLTEDTLGKRPGDFSVFYARMKQMKTWVMLACAAYDYLHNNARVLIWSKEMDKEKMCLRLASILGRVDYQLFKKGQLPRKVRKRAWKVFDELQNLEDVDYDDEGNFRRRKFILLCGREAPKFLSEVQGFISEQRPDVVYLDSFYHLRTAESSEKKQRHERLASLAEAVKELALEEEIPIVAVHQANRLGEKTHGNTMADIADSDVLAREADLIMRIIKRKGQELNEDDYEGARERAKERRKRRGKKPLLKRKEDMIRTFDDGEDEDLEPRVGAELAIVLPGNREGVLDAFTIKAVPGYDFSFLSSDYSVSDIEEWIKQDEAKDKKDKSGGGPKKPKEAEFQNSTFKRWKDSKKAKPPPGTRRESVLR
jgi:replicative DNA helicase